METVIRKRELLKHLKSQFKINWRGVHGPIHWGRVLKNGLIIAEREGARTDVVTLFALLHDHKRLDDGPDRDHGPRSVEAIKELRGEFFTIDDTGFDLLSEAIALHSNGLTEGDVTVRTCWDADRLDLGRMGTKPHPRYLCTDTAKDLSVLYAAYERSVSGKDTERNWHL